MPFIGSSNDSRTFGVSTSWRVRGICTLPFAAFLLFGCGTTVSVPAPYVEEIQSDDLDLKVFLRSVVDDAQANPESGLHRGRLALTYDANGFREAAAITYEQASLLDSDEALWPYLGALILADMGEHEKALTNVTEAIQRDPSYVPAWLHRGSWLLDLGNPEDALAVFDDVVAIASTEEYMLSAQSGRAQCYLRLKEPAKALQTLESLAYGNDHPYVMRQKGYALRDLGRFDEAETLLLEGAEISRLTWPDPRTDRTTPYKRGYTTRLMLAEDYLNKNHPDAAIAILESLQLNHPDDPSLINNLSIAYRLTGQDQKALNVLQKAVTDNPEDHLLHFNLATQLEEDGQLPSAIIHFTKAIEISPSLFPAYERKVRLLIDAARFDEAADTLNASFNYTEADPVLYHYAGIVEGLRGNWDASVARFRQALEIDPAYTKAYINMSLSLGEMRRFDEAKAALDRATTLNTHPGDADAAQQRINQMMNRN